MAKAAQSVDARFKETFGVRLNIFQNVTFL